MNQKRGFSLVEILVASALLVLCLWPVIGSSQDGLREARALQEHILGQQVLMDLCERFKSASPQDLEQVASSPERIRTDPYLLPLQSDRAGKGQTKPGGPRFERSLFFGKNFHQVDGLHRVTFLVTWKDRNGRDQKLSLSRIIHYH